MKTKNIIPVFYNLFRALEIAKTGNHTVSVYFHPEYSNGAADFKTVKDFCAGWFENFKPDGEIKVEIIKPDSYEYSGRNGESLTDISARIEKSLKNQRPGVILDEASISLLKTATNRLNLSLIQSETAKEISATIAQIDGSGKIRCEHIAEAVQYAIINEIAINAQDDDYLVFGGEIIIKRGNISSAAAREAIDYLLLRV